MKTVLLSIISILLLACNNSGVLSEPIIKCGNVKLTGQITSEVCKRKGIAGALRVTYPVTGALEEYKILTDSKGHFSLELECETNPVLCAFWSEVNYEAGIVFFLNDNQDAKLKIAYGADNELQKVDVLGGVMLSDSDMLNYGKAGFNMSNYRSENPKSMYDTNFDEYLNYANQILQERQSVAYRDTLLSEDIKNILAKDYAILFYSLSVLSYESSMRLDFLSWNNGKEPDSCDIQVPTIELYSSLRKLNLNDPQYLYSANLPDYFMKYILHNDILNITPIADTPIDVWLEQVKAIMSDLVGFDEGLFYDLLVSNSYSNQLKNEVKPLAQKQIENIKDYYKGGEIEKILLRKNDEIIKLATYKGEVIVNETPNVAKEQLLDAIISKYAGKTVVVDFWATWCVPCLQAMKESLPIKKELKEQDVVFVYITNPSSPTELWNEYIEGIGEEHYYLTGDEWNYIMNSFEELWGVPSYLIYDQNGNLKDQFTGYPGNDAMREKVEKAIES